MKLKIRSLWQKIEHFSANFKYRRLALILAPCAVVLLALAVVLSGSSAIAYRLRGPAPTPESLFVQTAPPVNAAAVASALPLASPAVIPTAQAAEQSAEKAVQTSLRASSADRDLYITVYDEAGRPVTGETFTLSVGYPDGQTYDFSTGTDGSCYLVRLEGGEYSVRMQEHAGYVTAEAITCTVREEQLVYERLENVDEYVDVREVTDVPQDEVETEDKYAAPSEAVAEELPTPQDTYAGEQIPVLDANGHQTYTYTYDVGENGFLLYRDSLEESDVLPVDEDEDGQLDYGIYYYIPQTPEEGTESGLSANGYYVSEILFNEDNTPVEKYAIYAEPIMSESGTKYAGWREINGSVYYCDEDGSPVKGLKKIDGKIYYFDQYGIRARSVGIDVSYYDGDINWQAVKAQGIDFAIIRVGGRTWQSGTIYYDNRTIEYFTEAKRAGLKVGAYFYSTAVSELEAVEEASVVLDVLNGVGLDYPVFYDTEYSGLYPEGRADHLDKVQRAAVIRAFCETIINSSNYAAGVYSGEYFMNNSLNYSSFSQYTVWLASYTADNKLPGFGGHYDIWQFTDRGVIDGINGYVDMNVIF